jgi:hypothetical protein
MKTASRAVALLTTAGLLATVGCGTTDAHLTATSAQPVGPLSLATSLTTTAGTWTVALAGGKEADYNNFWQLLVRPSTAASWQLATPPGVATNGGLVIAPLGGASLVVGLRPSQSLRFTPLADTSNAGRSWTSGLIGTVMASEPSAMAGDPATGKLLAVTASGAIEQGIASGTWAVTAKSLSDAACGHLRLTGVTFTPDGTPLAAGDCARPGVIGIFSNSGGTWTSAAPVAPEIFGRDRVFVLALATIADHTMALLQAGSGTGASVLVGELGTGGWSFSGPARLSGTSVSSLATGSAGEVGLVLANGEGLLLPSLGNSWRTLPRLPARTQTLAFVQGTQVQAVVPGRTSISFYDYQQAEATWTLAQKLKVPVQFGSSG